MTHNNCILMVSNTH